MDLNKTGIIETIPISKTTQKKLRTKTSPSVVNKLQPYDISDDILQYKSSATIGQMLQYPN